MTIRRLGICVLFMLTAFVAAAPVARAHAIVQHTEPGIDAVVEVSPERAVMHFNEPVEVAFGAIRVYDTTGQRVDASGRRERGERHLIYAHSGTAAGGVEIELLLLGLGFLAAAFFFRPSQTGNARSAVLCLLVGIALVTGSIAVPRLSGDDHSSAAQVAIVTPTDGAELVEDRPVNVRVELTNGTLARSASADTGGHMHLFVDGQLQSMPYSLEAQVTFERGERTLRVEYVDVRHVSYDPPVEDEVTVTVR